MANERPRRTCAFCEGSPVTKEHLWADWISETLHRLRPSPIKVGFEDGELQHTYQTNKLNITVARFCETCNNTWMSAIDNDVNGRSKWLLLQNSRFVANV